MHTINHFICHHLFQPHPRSRFLLASRICRPSKRVRKSSSRSRSRATRSRRFAGHGMGRSLKGAVITVWRQGRDTPFSPSRLRRSPTMVPITSSWRTTSAWTPPSSRSPSMVRISNILSKIWNFLYIKSSQTIATFHKKTQTCLFEIAFPPKGFGNFMLQLRLACSL